MFQQTQVGKKGWKKGRKSRGRGWGWRGFAKRADEGAAKGIRCLEYAANILQTALTSAPFYMRSAQGAVWGPPTLTAHSLPFSHSPTPRTIQVNEKMVAGKPKGAKHEMYSNLIKNSIL